MVDLAAEACDVGRTHRAADPGALTGTPAINLDFVFQVFPLIAIGLVTIVYALVSLDGESTWLEGLQLIAIYALVAVTALALPGR